MLKIDIEIDLPAFEKEVDDYLARTFQSAVVEALNKAGEAGRYAVRKEMISAFDRPNPFTLAGVDIMKVSVRTDGGDPSVLIFIRDRAASYLDLHVEDGALAPATRSAPGPSSPGPRRRGTFQAAISGESLRLRHLR